MDFTLTPEQATIGELAAGVLADPDQTLARAAEAGLLGAGLAEDVGGAGAGFVAVHLLLEEAGAAGSALPLWETVVLGALAIDRFGDAGLRRALLEPFARGELVLTAALLDDQPGDPREPQTAATRGSDGAWTLTGVKTLVPLADQAHRILVGARSDDGEIGVFLLDPQAPGVQVRPQHVLGGRTHAEVELTVAPAEALGGPEVLGWLLQHAQAGLASLVAGACRGALRLAAEHTSTREQFGRPLASFQAVGQRLADAYVDTEAVRLAALQAAWRLEQGLAADDEVAIAAWWAAEAGHRVIHAAQHVHGGAGVDRSYPLPGYFQTVKQAELALGGASSHLSRLGQALAAAP